MDLEINNASGVSLTGNLTINSTRNLILTAGALSIGTNTLTINGTITGSGTITGGTNANLVLGGAGDPEFLRFTNDPGTLNNFTLTRDPEDIVSLMSNLKVTGTFTNTDGVLDFSGYELQISGPYTGGAAEFSTDAGSSLRVNTAGAFTGDIIFEAGDILGLLRINRGSTTVNIGSANVNVSRLELLAGTLNNTNSLWMQTGGTIYRTAGSMTTVPGSTNTYSVEYGGAALTTGNELPNIVGRLQKLRILGSGPYTLNKNITINDSALFVSGNFLAGANTITMKGAAWKVEGGTFTPGTGKVTFSGTTNLIGSNPIEFYNIEIAAAGTVGLPSTEMFVANNYQAFAGATVNHNSGTVEMNGSADQIIAAGGSSLYNVNVNKSGGNVTLNNALNLVGTLDIQSTPTVFNSNGNLTLKSTTDAGGGDARIAAIPSGILYFRRCYY